MRFRLIEELITNKADGDKIPLLSSGIPDWGTIFKETHPIDSSKDSSSYLGMTAEQLWDAFWEDDNFEKATGIKNAGQKLKEHFGDILTEELVKLGFAKNANPFLNFLEDTYITNPGLFISLPKCYGALHNAYIKHQIKKGDLLGVTESIGQLLHNGNLYNYAPADLVKIIDQLTRGLQGTVGFASPDLETKFKGKPDLIIKAVLVTGLAADDSVIAAVDLQHNPLRLSTKEIRLNLETLFGDLTKKETPADTPEALKEIKDKFGLTDASKAVWTNENKKSASDKSTAELHIAVAYLALAAAGHTALIRNLHLTDYLPYVIADYDKFVQKGATLNFDYSAQFMRKLVSDLNS